MKVVATGSPAADIAVDGAFVYFSNPSAAVVAKVPIDGGDVTILSSSPTASRVAIDERTVYFTSNFDGAVRSVPKGGGPTIVLAEGGRSGAIAVRDDHVWWADLGGTIVNAGQTSLMSGKLRTVRTDGTGLADLFTDYAPADIAVDNQDVYLTLSLGTFVYRVPRSGGAREIATEDLGSTDGLAIDANRAFWGGSRGLQSAPLRTQRAPTLLAKGHPTRLVVDDQNVYFADYEGAAIRRIAKSGGEVVTVASSQPTPSAIAVDDTSVYWVTGTYGKGGAIMRATPK